MRRDFRFSTGRAAIVTVLILAVAACGSPSSKSPGEAEESSAFSVIPAPRSLTPGTGAFRIPPTVTVAVSDPDDAQLADLAALVADLLRHQARTEVVVSDEPAAASVAGTVVLSLDEAGVAGAEPDFEAYVLEVTSDGVTLAAAAHAGLFYGIQTLRQLITTADDGTGEIPAVVIDDAPRFPYRGMHLDVGRHFFPVDFIKRYIDLMSRYKMNTFHWHLTEDQGWRLEIAKHPKLTEIGSCRAETMLEKNYEPYVGDGVEYCGFYTQDEAREVVEYAAARYVTVIPEIEMPGHSLAALSAYPELACTPGPFAAATRWGIFPDIYCPTEETFAFLEDVLAEVMEIFPSRYIHIGGDEAPKERWEESPEAQAVIEREGLADEHELQSYFIRRIEQFLIANGRRLIGWDEILEGGLAPEATVMSWRGIQGGIEAARQGHDVIMTPTSHAYFDYYQGDPAVEPIAIGGFLPLERVYGFDPIPDELTPEQAQHILGAQGNVWTEFMKTPEKVEYMAYPRALAMAEIGWSPAKARDFDDFERRLPTALERLDAMGVNFRIPQVSGLDHDRVSLDGRFTVALSSLFDDAKIHYTLDGSEPTAESPRYEGPIEITADEAGTVVTARVVLDSGRPGTLARARFRKAALRLAEATDSEGLSPGLEYAYIEYDNRVLSVDQLETMVPTSTGVTESVSLDVAGRDEMFGLTFTGYLHAPESGIYIFTLTSDDGSRLSIGDELVVDNDGIHQVATRSGMIALEAGLHPLTIRYFQRSRGSALEVVGALEGADKPHEIGEWLLRR